MRSIEEVGEDNICFEEKLCVGMDEDLAYKILRGNAIKMLELDRV